MKKTLTLLVSLLAAVVIAAQQPGSLDLTFGNNGISLYNFNLSTLGRAMEVLPDDRILLTGIAEHETGSDGFLARYLADGQLDESFGNSGFVILGSSGLYTSFYSIALTSDNKIVLAGKAYYNGKDHMAVCRLNFDGTPDVDFGVDGVVLHGLIGGSGEICEALAIDGDGRILLGGTTWFDGSPKALLARLNTSGAIDTEFGTDGFVVSEFTSNLLFPEATFESIIVQPDGKIVTGGYYGSVTAFAFLVSRFLPDGNLDLDFGVNGHFTMGNLVGEYQVYDMHLMPGGEILIGGMVNITSTPAFGLLRLTPSGVPDSGFGQGGFALPLISLNGSYGHALKLDANGNILLGGSSGSGFALVRFLPSGFVDNSFGNAGVAIVNVTNGFGMGHAVDLQSTGKIILSGFRHNSQSFINEAAVLRFDSDATATGIADFEAGYVHVFPNPFSNSVTIELPRVSYGSVLSTIHDLAGKVVAQSVVQPGVTASQQIDMNGLNDLSPGVYILKVSINDQIRTAKLLKH